MNLDAPGLETSLIRLEPLAERHRADLLSRGVGDELWRLMPTIPAGNTLAAYFDHILRMPALGTGQGYAVILRETGAFIGFAVFHPLMKGLDQRAEDFEDEEEGIGYH